MSWRDGHRPPRAGSHSFGNISATKRAIVIGLLWACPLRCCLSYGVGEGSYKLFLHFFFSSRNQGFLFASLPLPTLHVLTNWLISRKVRARGLARKILQRIQRSYAYIYIYCGFGGLGVACWPLVPKFAGSNPAEAVGFLKGEKKSSARLPSEGK